MRYSKRRYKKWLKNLEKEFIERAKENENTFELLLKYEINKIMYSRDKFRTEFVIGQDIKEVVDEFFARGIEFWLTDHKIQLERAKEKYSQNEE